MLEAPCHWSSSATSRSFSPLWTSVVSSRSSLGGESWHLRLPCRQGYSAGRPAICLQAVGGSRSSLSGPNRGSDGTRRHAPVLASPKGQREGIQRYAEDFLWRQLVGQDVDIRVLLGVIQTPFHLVPPSCAGIGGPALASSLPRDVQEDQHVRLSDTLPHCGYTGVFLYYLAGVVPLLSQRLHERRFPRSTRSDYGDQRTFFPVSSFHYSVDFLGENRRFSHRRRGLSLLPLAGLGCSPLILCRSANASSEAKTTR